MPDDLASIKSDLQESAWVSSYNLDPIAWHSLQQRVCERPDAWWTELKGLIEQAPAKLAGNLGMAPLKAILGCRDGNLQTTVLAEARRERRLACAVAEVLSREEIFTQLGTNCVVSTYLRNLVEHNDFDSWAWEAIEETISEDTETAWLLLLSLIDTAPDEESRGLIGAGPLENFIMANADGFIERIEAAASGRPRFKEALASVWIMSLRPDLFARVEAAAGVPLRRI